MLRICFKTNSKWEIIDAESFERHFTGSDCLHNVRVAFGIGVFTVQAKLRFNSNVEKFCDNTSAVFLLLQFTLCLNLWLVSTVSDQPLFFQTESTNTCFQWNLHLY